MSQRCGPCITGFARPAKRPVAASGVRLPGSRPAPRGLELLEGPGQVGGGFRWALLLDQQVPKLVAGAGEIDQHPETVKGRNRLLVLPDGLSEMALFAKQPGPDELNAGRLRRVR